jgi:hypothetical protein
MIAQEKGYDKSPLEVPTAMCSCHEDDTGTFFASPKSDEIDADGWREQHEVRWATFRCGNK